MPPLNRQDRRLLRWLATFCAPSGAEVGTVSPTVQRCERRGLITREAQRIALTPKGREALRAAQEPSS